MNDDGELHAGQESGKPAERRRLASPRALLAAEEILGRWMAEGEDGALDRLVQAEMRQRRSLNSSERRWIGDTVFGAVRFFRRQTWTLGHSGLETGARQRIELWAKESCGGENKDSQPVLPGLERPAEYLRETLSYSDEMAAALEETLGTEALPAAEALNLQAPTTLRVNPLRTTRGRVLRSIPGSLRTRFSPWGVEIEGRANIHELPGFRDGWFEVQEEASQLVALLTDARPGQTVIDVGAGAGGKSLAIAAMMGNIGLILAADTSQERLTRLEQRAERAGAKAIRPLLLNADAEGRWQLSATKQRTVGKLGGTADCVLVDAPCSGSGVLRRSPDAKWRKTDHTQFAKLQALLLEQSAGFIAPEGCLIYATCAFETAQNEEVIAQFLASEAGAAFEVTPALPRLEQAINRLAPSAESGAIVPTTTELEALVSGPFLRTWPHRNGLDAFFAACLVRRA